MKPNPSPAAAVRIPVLLAQLHLEYPAVELELEANSSGNLFGALAGIGGQATASFSSGWAQSIGEPYLFSGLAAVLVDGTTFGSIRGSFTRTLLGALILTGLSTIIVSNGLAEAQSRIIYGVIILIVVALYGRERHVRDRF